MDSILNTVKKILGIDPECEDFDVDITIHVNSIFSTLYQMGVIKDEFAITDDSDTWDAVIIPNSVLGLVKTYIPLKTKLLFDPPSNSFTVTSLENSVKEYEWRLYTHAGQF